MIETATTQITIIAILRTGPTTFADSPLDTVLVRFFVKAKNPAANSTNVIPESEQIEKGRKLEDVLLLCRLRRPLRCVTNFISSVRPSDLSSIWLFILNPGKWELPPHHDNPLLRVTHGVFEQSLG